MNVGPLRDRVRCAGFVCARRTADLDQLGPGEVLHVVRAFGNLDFQVHRPAKLNAAKPDFIIDVAELHVVPEFAFLIVQRNAVQTVLQRTSMLALGRLPTMKAAPLLTYHRAKLARFALSILRPAGDFRRTIHGVFPIKGIKQSLDDALIEPRLGRSRPDRSA
jgi:hypothetical protein